MTGGRAESEAGSLQDWAGTGYSWNVHAELRRGPRKALGQVSQPLAPRKTWKQDKSMELGWDVLRHMDSSLQEQRSQAK